MRRSVVLSIFLVLAALALPPSAFAAKRVALIIGISDYSTLSKLNNPVTDAKAIAGALREHGFEVTEHYDLSRAELLDALEEFSSVADQASVALVYYAGHGMEMAGKNVLAPKDMEIDCEKKTPRRALDLDQLFSAVSGAPQQIVLLDACRNDPFPQCPSRSIGGGGGFRGFTRVGAEDRSLLIANSTLGGQLAEDGPPGQHSPFATALLAHFSSDSGSYLRDLLEAAAGDVQRESHGSQVPEILTRGSAVRICLDEAKCGAISTSPAPQPSESDPALDAWNAAKDTGSSSVLEAFIGRFGGSFYAELAKARLQELKKQEEARRVAVVTPPPPVAPESPEPENVNVAPGDKNVSDFKLCNTTRSRVGVAIGYRDSAGWATEGWWNVASHTCETILKGKLISPFYYLYAIDYDRGGNWSGKSFLCTDGKAFTIRGTENCLKRGYKRTGYFIVDTKGQSGWTVRLTEAGK
jgi:uncharacterized membrane protein